MCLNLRTSRSHTLDWCGALGVIISTLCFSSPAIQSISARSGSERCSGVPFWLQKLAPLTSQITLRTPRRAKNLSIPWRNYRCPLMVLSSSQMDRVSSRASQEEPHSFFRQSFNWNVERSKLVNAGVWEWSRSKRQSFSGDVSYIWCESFHLSFPAWNTLQLNRS